MNRLITYLYCLFLITFPGSIQDPIFSVATLDDNFDISARIRPADRTARMIVEENRQESSWQYLWPLPPDRGQQRYIVSRQMPETRKSPGLLMINLKEHLNSRKNEMVNCTVSDGQRIPAECSGPSGTRDLCIDRRGHCRS